MGGLYAQQQGESPEVAQAIYDHYLPKSIDDAIPRSVHGQLLSIADKLDSLEGCFGEGMIPTGSKDPLGLRRAAQGIVKILVEGRLRLNWKKAIEAGVEANQLVFRKPLPSEGGADVAAQLKEFMLDRVYYFRDVKNFGYDEVSAVLAADPDDLPDLEARFSRSGSYTRPKTSTRWQPLQTNRQHPEAGRRRLRRSGQGSAA